MFSVFTTSWLYVFAVDLVLNAVHVTKDETLPSILLCVKVNSLVNRFNPITDVFLVEKVKMAAPAAGLNNLTVLDHFGGSTKMSTPR